VTPLRTPYAGVIAIWCVPTENPKQAGRALPASADATHDPKLMAPKMLTPVLTYIKCDAKPVAKLSC